MEDRQRMLQKIQEVSFAINDLTLYLDTHPTDESALTEFQMRADERKKLLAAYAKEFEPLTIDCISPENDHQTQTCTQYAGRKHFTWSDGPLPWEGGI